MSISSIFWKLLARDFGGVRALGLPEPGRAAVRAAQDSLRGDVLAVREQGDNAGTFVERYLASVGLGKGNPWCQAFVNFRLIRAAQALGIVIPKEFPRTGSTVVASNYFKKKGWWISRADVELGKAMPKVGDVAYFYFPAKGRIAHTGIVVGVEKTGVWVVEGNTNDGTGVVREGIGVFKRFRTWKQIGLLGGFARVPW